MDSIFQGQIKTIQGNYAGFFVNLHGAIREGKALIVKPVEALTTIRVLEACLESNHIKKTIDFLP